VLGGLPWVSAETVEILIYLLAANSQSYPVRALRPIDTSVLTSFAAPSCDIATEWTRFVNESSYMVLQTAQTLTSPDLWLL